MSAPDAAYSSHASHWGLDPAIHFLNHGSFGACPRAVLAEQDRWRTRMERQPVQFLARDLETLLDEARAPLAAFLGAQPADVAWVANATAGVNAVLRSLSFASGDELIATDHCYNACRNTLDFVAARTGARVIVAAIPFPLADAGQAVDAILARVGPRTRLALLDHVTSPTGLVLPIERLVRALADRGVDVLVDGAHAPGMLELDIARLGAAYYTGNCHKWLCAPKGAGFLYVRPDRQPDVHPIAISHGANSPRRDRSRFLLEFDWAGTADPSPMLCVPAALRFMESLLPGGWPALRARNCALALEARARLCDALEIPAPCPDAMIGSLVAVPLPAGSGEAPSSPLYADPLQQTLLERWSIEVPIVPWPAPPARLVRVSAQIYNAMSQYELLASALRALFFDSAAARADRSPRSVGAASSRDGNADPRAIRRSD
jgi:isopenicillin-N epimerase